MESDVNVVLCGRIFSQRFRWDPFYGKLWLLLKSLYFHYVKSVQIRSFFWSEYVNIGIRVSLRIQSEYGKIRTRKNSVSGLFSRSVCLLLTQHFEDVPRTRRFKIFRIKIMTNCPRQSLTSIQFWRKVFRITFHRQRLDI